MQFLAFVVADDNTDLTALAGSELDVWHKKTRSRRAVFVACIEAVQNHPKIEPIGATKMPITLTTKTPVMVEKSALNTLIKFKIHPPTLAKRMAM